MLRRSLLALAVVGLLAGTVRAHIPPPIWMYIEVEDEEVVWGLVVDTRIFTEWFGPEVKDISEATPEEARALTVAAERFFARFTRVEIDHIPVKGKLKSLKIDLIDIQKWPYAHVQMAFGAKGRAKQISVTWKKYETAGGWWMKGIDSEIFAYEDADYFLFSKREPEYIWHAAVGEVLVNPFERPPAVSAPMLPVPVVSLVVLLAGLLAFPFLRSRPGARRASAQTVIFLALALAGVAVAEVPMPWGSRFERPTEEEAKSIFTQLHRNIYRAFDYEEEGAVYDTLRLSVTGDLLDRIYTEIFQSLIARDAGGAIVTVKSTRILAMEIAFPKHPHEPWFGVTCRWQVHGQITHYGHTHVRVNEYQAEYAVALGPEGWRIASVDVTSQERLDSQRFGRGPGGDDNDTEEPK